MSTWIWLEIQGSETQVFLILFSYTSFFLSSPDLNLFELMNKDHDASVPPDSFAKEHSWTSYLTLLTSIIFIIWISSHDLSIFVNHELDFVWFKLFESFGVSCLWSSQLFDLWNFSTFWLLDNLRLMSSFVDSFEIFNVLTLPCFEPRLAHH